LELFTRDDILKSKRDVFPFFVWNINKKRFSYLSAYRDVIPLY
jgi:hypothetical protein